MSLEISRDCLTDNHRAARETKSQYLSNIISSSSHCPKVLFYTINAVVNPCTSAVTDVSAAAEIVAPTHSAVFNQLKLVSLSSLGDVVKC